MKKPKLQQFSPFRFVRPSLFYGALAMLTVTAGSARAATLTWDVTTGDGATITDGTGTWTATAGNFNTGSGDTTWSNTNDAGFIAQFGGGSSGTAGTVAITGTVTPAGISFVPASAGAYTLGTTTAGTIALAGAAPSISLTTSTGTINSTLTTATSSALTINGTNAGLAQLFLGGTANSIGGTVNLSGTNILINAGQANGVNGLSGASAITVGSNNTIRWNANETITSNFTLTGIGAGGRGALSFYGGSATSVSGGITLAGNTVINNRTTTTTLGGNIGESTTPSTLTITSDLAASTVVFNGNNSFSGGLTFNSFVTGTVIKAGSSTAFGTGTLTFSTMFGTGVDTNSSADLNGQTITIGGLTGGDSSRFINNTSSTAAQLTVSNTTTTNNFAGVIQDGTGGVSLVKAGTGTLTLSGANTFSGSTKVTGGILALANVNALQNSPLDVSGAGTVNFTVAGTNTYKIGSLINLGTLNAGANSLTVNGVSPGATPGTLNVTTGALTLNSTAASAFQINGTGKGTTYDVLNVTGALAYGGALTINLGASFTPANNSTYDLFDYTTTESGTFNSITIGNGSQYSGSLNYSSGILTITAVPEPSTWIAGAMCILIGLGVRYRRGSV